MASQQVCTLTSAIVLLIAIFTCPFASCLLVPPTPLNLQYHRGPLLAGDGPIKLHLTFYGDFTSLEKHTIKSFLHSLSDAPSNIAQETSYKAPHKSLRLSLKSLSRSPTLAPREEEKPLGSSSKSLARSGSSSKPLARSGSSSQFLRDPLREPSSVLENSESASQILRDPSRETSSRLEESGSSQFLREPSSMLEGSGSSSPTVAKWWSLTQAYTDVRGNRVSQAVLVHEASDNYSHGKLLSHSDIASLAKSSARRAARGVSHAEKDHSSIHIILTAADVGVEGFCMHACGQHAHTESDGELGKVVYAWVGNAREQCPGYCEWPFVRTEYGPDMEPSRAPNSASADGMIISLAKLLVEAATNPFGDGYYLGGGSHGVGVGEVCTGAYGEGAFPGYPGRVLKDPETGASFNVMGLHHSKFLLPYVWNPHTLSCAVHP